MDIKQTRTKTVYINTIIVICTHLLQIVFGFGIRKVFIMTLGVTYLGYNSVFSNVLSMLNMADLGIGIAITSFLYKPLAQHDLPRICALMQIYKKIYRILGAIILALGLVISCFLTMIIPDAHCSPGYLRLLFYINLLGTVSTYYLAYKRTLINADERSYESALVDMVTFLVTSILQVIFLFIYPSYIIYLIITVIKNIISNFILSLRCNREYPFLKQQANDDLVREYRKPIIQYVKDLFASKIGAYVFNNTDNLIISIFRGSLLTGYLSNYTLITMQVQTLITSILGAVQATLGQYINTETDNMKKRRVINCYLFADYYIGNFCFLCITFLAGPFISLAFGSQYELNMSTSFWLGINLMLAIMLQVPSQLFVIYKLYHYDRWIIAISASANIIISALLVQFMGIDGVLIGTFITSQVYLFSRLYIVYHYVYNVSLWTDIGKFLYYYIISAISACFIALTLYLLPNYSSFLDFFVKTLIVGVEALSFPILFFLKREEFSFLIRKFLPQLKIPFVSNRLSEKNNEL